MTLRLAVFSALALVLLCGTAAAQEDGFGLGVILGEPTGVSGKLWLGSSMAMDGAAAWSFNKDGKLHLHVDYLYHSFTDRLALYYGIGARAKLEDKTRFGIRFPLGVTYISMPPVDIFLEIAPMLDLAPGTDFRLNASIGFRFFLW